MLTNVESLRYFLSEGFLSLFFLFLLIAGLADRDRFKNSSYVYLLGVYGIIITLVLELYLTTGGKGNEHLLFYGMLRNDYFSHLFKLLLIFSSLFLLIFSFISKETGTKSPNSVEYVLLILANTLGMMLLASSVNLLMMYLSLEFLSLTAYLLTGFIDGDERRTEAAIKYLLFGAVASGVMLYGLSLLYGMAGTLDYFAIQEYFAQNNVSGVVTYISVIFILAGAGFKIAAFPFHSWCPDVYEGAATPFTAFLSVGSKSAGFALIVRFFYQIFIEKNGGDTLVPIGGVDWSMLLAIISAFTMTLGNLAALQQENIKRLLAYSGIAHAGYILMAVASQTQFGVSSVFLYLVIYFLMNFGAFLVVIIIANEIGKVYLFLSVFEKGSSLYWLAVVAIINMVISLYYYMRVIKLMFLLKGREGVELSAMDRTQYFQYSIMVGLSFLTVLFGIYWVPLDILSKLAANFLN
jgi:NADH-quinone oxidoreductase subunit N